MRTKMFICQLILLGEKVFLIRPDPLRPVGCFRSSSLGLRFLCSNFWQMVVRWYHQQQRAWAIRSNFGV